MHLSSPVETASLDLANWQQIYNRHRFLDVFEATAPWWNAATDVSCLSTEELIFAGRMALRLGGLRLSRSLFRRARKKEPTHPAVRYFTDHLRQRGYLLLDDLVAFEVHPRLAGADAKLEADWFANYAVRWAQLRHWERAAELIREAHSLSPDSAWLHSIESDIYGMADDWGTALHSAERGWQIDSSSPGVVSSIATALLHNGELHEAVRRLEWVATGTHSAQIVQTACWYRCAAAELLEGEERLASLEAARALAARIEPLSPLADREFRSSLARTWLDIAQLAGDHQAMEQWAEEARSPFHRRVLHSLRQNPQGEVIRLPYRRTLQKHQECVPASVTSALSANGVEIDTAELAAEVTFGGTAEWAAADWLRGRGMHVRFFQATEKIATRLLAAGFAFVTSWEDDDSGHAVAVIGIDHAAGILLVHDPMSFRTAEYLLSVFDEGGSPLGVLGMAAVSRSRAMELDRLLPPEAVIAASAQEHSKRLRLTGPSAALPVVTALAAEFPNHPGTQYLMAIQDLEEGRMGQALLSLSELARRFPRAQRLRSQLMYACRSVGDTALLRQTLQTVVETGTVPGVKSEVEWVRPHARYLCDYADLLRTVSETRTHAETLLRSALRTNWASAYAWHVLADLRWEEMQYQSALLAYSVASRLANHDEHYARAYADALAREGRTEEGLDWLERRALELGSSVPGVSTWITWIDALEDLGCPQRAVTVLEAASEQHPFEPTLLAYAAPFLARMGYWQEAESKLQELATSAQKGAFHEAAVSFYKMSGAPEEALSHAELWMAEFPRSMSARNAYLDLLRTLKGSSVAAAQAAEWMLVYPADEDYEAAFCNHAENRFAWRRVRLLRARIRRNPSDGWAWRELLFQGLGVYEQSGPKRRQRLRPYLELCLAEAERLSQGSPVMQRAQAFWLEDQGEWREAVALYLKSIEADPSHFYGYRRAWDCAASLPDSERQELWARMEPLYLQTHGHLPNALEMIGLLAARFGVRKTELIVARWMAKRPDDPNVLEAAADLLLNHGQGRSDAARALELLLMALQRFPYHSGLRFSLGAAYRANGDDSAADEAFAELVRRRPDDEAALIQLAWIQHGAGKKEEAFALLDRAHRQKPRSVGTSDNRARLLIEEGRIEEARTVVEDLLRSLPDEVSTYSRSIALLNQCGLPEQAVEAARAGVRAFPRGAYLWMLLGETLQKHPACAAPGEVEACLRRSLGHNHTLFDSVDWLAVYLADQHRHEEAIELLRAIEPDMADPSSSLGRIAWLERQNGKDRQATEAMIAVVQNAPWYTWGWGRLLVWLEEDKDWTQARDLLHVVAPPQLTNLELRQSRLKLLQKAGVPASELDAEWTELLRDFPRDIPLQLRRYDSLLESQKTVEAAEVVRRALPDAPLNPYLLARLVAVECAEKNFDEADRHALTVCFVAAEDSEWPADQIWKHMRRALRAAEFAARFDRELQNGRRPTRHSLVLFAKEWIDSASASKTPGWMHGSVLDPRRRKASALLRLVDQSTWQEPGYLADLMSVLNSSKYYRLVLRCWKHIQAAGLGNNTPAWAQAGLAMINQGNKRAARKLLGDWRSRPGVQMWMVANYLIASSRFSSRQFADIAASAHEALATLRHDHTMRFIVYMEAEALTLAGDTEGLLATWAAHPHVFAAGAEIESGEYFPTIRRYLIHDLARAVSRLNADPNASLRRSVWRLRLQRLWDKDVRRKARKILVYLVRAILALTAMSGFLRTLFS